MKKKCKRTTYKPVMIIPSQPVAQVTEMQNYFLDDDDEIDTCKVCMEMYTDNCRPRSLTCGHSFCTKCLSTLTRSGNFKCPKCQRLQVGVKSNDFPINYDLEEMISKFRKMQQNSKTPALVTPPPSTVVTSPSKTVSNKLLGFIEDQIDTAEQLLQNTDESLGAIVKCRLFVKERIAKHKAHLPKIIELLKKCEGIIASLEEDDTLLMESQSLGEVLKDELNTTISLLRDDQSFAAMGDFDRHCCELEQWNQTARGAVTQNATLTLSDKILPATTEALNTFSEQENTVMGSENLNPFNFWTFASDAVPASFKGHSKISCGRLMTMSTPTRNLVEMGKVVAVQENKGNICYAKLSCSKSHIYLHHLREVEALPPSSYIIEQRELVGKLPSESVTAFMDLAWNGVIQGRVYILLEPSTTPLAQHFLALCTGEKGPSFSQCTFLEVVCKGDKSSEGVRTGDYEFNDGTGGASVLEPGIKLDDSQYNRTLTPGLVWATYDEDDGPQVSQFTITTAHIKSEFQYKKVFGVVKEGLEVVRAAIDVEDIKSVKIVDCGVVVPLS